MAIHDEEDEPLVFARHAWRRVIRSPFTRRALTRSRRQPRSRHWVRAWSRAAVDHERRPTYRG